MGKLSGKVALVTGGNSGMGLESARLLAAEGAKVIITGRRQNDLSEAEKYIGPAGLAVQGDVSKMADLDRLFAVIKEKFGRVQKALPLLRDGASIILNSSIAGTKGMEAMSVYSATKAAVRSLARSWTNDLRSRKIRVNSLSPGPIETPIFGKMGLNQEQANGFKQALPGMVPLGRMGTSEEIAKTVLFLASDDSSYITGIDLVVDGGMAQI
jgi:NAD(P)-dependent dehydrogenase (short-subunit alcohol dehydrogenase family)